MLPEPPMNSSPELGQVTMYMSGSYQGRQATQFGPCGARAGVARSSSLQSVDCLLLKLPLSARSSYTNGKFFIHALSADMLTNKRSLGGRVEHVASPQVPLARAPCSYARVDGMICMPCLNNGEGRMQRILCPLPKHMPAA